MASSPLKKLTEQLTCAVCLDLYTNPKILPCLHSFCLQCLEKFPLDPQGDNYFIVCPTCRHRTQLPPEPEGPAGFPTAFYLNHFMEIHNQMNCKTPDPLQQSCSNHQKPLEIFCEACHKVICLHCIDEEHRDHDWKLVPDSYPKHCQELELSLNHIREKADAIKNVLTAITDRQNQIGDQNEAVKREIRVMEEEMISAIRESTRQLTREVETATDGKLRVLSEQKQSAEMSLGCLIACDEYVEQSIRVCSKQELLMSKKQMMELMSQVTQEINVEEFNPIEKVDIQLIKDSKATIGVTHIGDIVFTSLQQCKVKQFVQAVCPSQEEVSFPVSLECPDSSLLTVPVSSINCSLVPVGRQPIKATVKRIKYPGVYKIHCSPLMHGHYHINVQVHDVQIEGTSLEIPFNPYLDTITPMRTISKLNCPHGVAISDDGSCVIVTENMGNCVTVLDCKGNKIETFGGEKENSNVYFNLPYRVAITPDNFILVTDDKHRIQKVTMDGVCIASVGVVGKGQLQFNYPAGIAISPITGHIHIADSGNHRIQVLTSDLTFFHSFGKKGSAEGQFKEPRDIAIDSKGWLYVADSRNHRIQVFNQKGHFITQFGTKGSGPGQLNSPVGIAVDRSTDLIYITEEMNNRISIFKNNGEFVNIYGEKEKLFFRPKGIQHVQGQLYVCDERNNRLVIM